VSTSSIEHGPRTPITWATALGFVCCYFDLTPPEFVANTTKLIGSFTVPMMLIMLGVSLASMKATNLRRALVVSVVRLAAGPCVGFLVAHWLDLHGVTRGVLVLQCAMPVAVFNYLLAVRFERSADDVAGLIVISTALSLLSLPLLLSILL
jgi:predicted permease